MGEVSRRPHAAVIGSGFGGLACAIRLQNAGFDTTIYEARDKPGGRAYVYEMDGFTFDGGPTVITAPHCLEELFEEAGRRMSDYVELLPVAPFYRLLWEDGTRFDYDGSSDNMVAQIAARNPDDAEGYLRFVEYSRKVFEAGYEGLVDTPFLRFSDMIRVAPELVGLRADRSVYKAVSRYVKDEKIREALSFHSLLVGGNPFTTSAIYTLIHYLERKWGVFFPRGGTGALIAALVTLFEELGGHVRLSSPVESIRVERGPAGAVHRVRAGRAGQPDQALDEASFDLVVSNADVHHTYEQLYGEEPAARKRARKLARKDWSMSLFVLYFGCDRTYADELVHHTILFGPRYRGLLDEIFGKKAVPGGLSEDFSLYLHAPTLTDPSLAPPGCGAFYVLSPVPHLGHAPLDWEAIAPGYADRILAALEQHMPDLRKHVVCRHWITPAHFQGELRSHLGSAFSVAPRLTQSAYFRPHNRDRHIPGLYLAGAGTHPGAGVPGVVNSAKATARVILGDFAERLAGEHEPVTAPGPEALAS